jgi:hypothetical protein
MFSLHRILSSAIWQTAYDVKISRFRFVTATGADYTIQRVPEFQ